MKRTFFRVIFLGDSEVGKTSIGAQFAQNNFAQSYKATIGADFFNKNITTKYGTVCLEIWDTAGQERFGTLGHAFYQGADGCALVYDITNSRSFESLDMWKDNFIEKGAHRDPEHYPFILIGNKVDRETERQVSTTQAQEWCDRNGGIQLFEASAKENLMVEEAFQSLCELTCKREEEYQHKYML